MSINGKKNKSKNKEEEAFKLNKTDVDKETSNPEQIVKELQEEETKFKNYLAKIIKEEAILLKVNEELQEKYDKKMKFIEKKMKTNKVNSFLSSSYMMQKCEGVVGYFLHDIAISTLQIKIEGIKDPITLLSNSNKTFLDLKKEIKHYFAKRETDFFLANENGIIYLDDLVVKNCLFPLKHSVIRDYIPYIYVMEQKNSGAEIFKINIKKKVENENKEENEEEAIRKTKIKRTGTWLSFFQIISLINYLVLIVLWILSSKKLRRIDDYKNIDNFFLSNNEMYNKETINVN